MKRILLTGGPTIEPIDEIMKITNFSTGGLSVKLAGRFLEAGYAVTMVVNHMVDTKDLQDTYDDERLKVVGIETTDEMLGAIQVESEREHYDALMHTSAVGDYKSDFVFLMEDMAQEIFKRNAEKPFQNPDEILEIMRSPSCKLDDSSKISSYQENLTVKLALTPKIIARLREWFPDTLLIGCKLLENVSKDELFEVATKLCNKNNMDYIMANDLAELHRGKTERYLVTKDGFSGEVLNTDEDMYKFVKGKLEG